MLLSLTTFNVCPELRPLCSTGIARLRRSYWPLGQVSQQFSVSPGLSSTNRFAGNTIELLLATMRTPSKLWRVVVRRLGCCSHPCRRFPANGCPLLTESKCKGINRARLELNSNSENVPHDARCCGCCCFSDDIGLRRERAGDHVIIVGVGAGRALDGCGSG